MTVKKYGKSSSMNIPVLKITRMMTFKHLRTFAVKFLQERNWSSTLSEIIIQN